MYVCNRGLGFESNFCTVAVPSQAERAEDSAEAGMAKARAAGAGTAKWRERSRRRIWRRRGGWNDRGVVCYDDRVSAYVDCIVVRVLHKLWQAVERVERNQLLVLTRQQQKANANERNNSTLDGKLLFAIRVVNLNCRRRARLQLPATCRVWRQYKSCHIKLDAFIYR